jgi:pimeloyl-ACP methyl ester carboxylesterase
MGETDTRRVVVDVPPYRIHSLESGTDGEPLILLHGLSGSSRWWDRNVAALGKHFRVLVPDVIGFGRTRIPPPLPGLERMAELLAAWMEAVGAPESDLIGHSMGGQIAIHLAALLPDRVRRLVLVDSAGIPRPARARELFRFAAEVAAPARWGDVTFFPTIVGDALHAGPRTITQALGHILRDDVRPLLPRISAPTLIVWGENDRICPVEHAYLLRERIPDSRLIVLRRAAHNAMIDRPADFNDVVLRFLRGETVGK